MLQDDFLMRQIKQLAQFLAALIGSAREGKFDEAAVELERAWLSYVGMRRSMADRLDETSLVTVIGKERARMALALVEAEAKIAATRGEDASGRMQRAARLRATLGIAPNGPALDPSEDH